MANVVLFNTNNNQYLLSVDTSKYVTGTPSSKGSANSVALTNVIINPDLSLVTGVPIKYWKKGSGNQVVEMSSSEKAALDNAATAAQESTPVIVTNRITTTDATPTTIQTLSTTNDSTYTIEGVVVARRTGGSAGTNGDGGKWKFEAAYKNVGGTVTLIGSVRGTADKSQASWDVSASISGSNINVSVTGSANNNISWIFFARINQVLI